MENYKIFKNYRLLKKTLTRLPGWILIFGSFFIIPFIFTTSTIDPVTDIRFFVFSILIFVLFPILLFQQLINTQSILFLKRKIFIPIFGYFIVNIIALITAINVYEGVIEVLKISLYISYLVVCIILLETKISRESLSKSIIVCSLILSLIGIAQYYFNLQSIPGGWGFPYSTMANGNLFSSVLFLTIPFIFYGVFVFNNSWKIVSNISLSLSIIIIVIVQTRSVWLACFVSVLFIIPFIILIHKKSKSDNTNNNQLRNRIINFILVILMSIFVSILSSNYHNPERSVIDRVSSIANLNDPSVNERIILWQKSIKIFLDNPILGVGPGNWKIVFPQYGTNGLRAETGFTNFRRPHNDYLWILTETGIFGLIFYLLIFFFVFYYGIKTLFQIHSMNQKIYIMCLLFGITGYLVISFFSFPKERITHGIFLTLIISNIISIYHESFPLKVILKIPRGLLVILVMIIVSISGYVGYIRFISDQCMKNVLFYRQQNQWGNLIDEVDKIDSYFYTIDNSVTPVVWYRGVANYSLKNYIKAYTDFYKSLKVHPNNVHVLNNLATISEERGKHNKAIIYYKKAITIAPKFEEALLNLSAVYYNTGKYQLASDTISQIAENGSSTKIQSYREKISNKLNGEKK